MGCQLTDALVGGLVPETEAATPYMMRPTGTPRTGCGLAIAHPKKLFFLLNIPFVSVNRICTQGGEGVLLVCSASLTKLTPKKGRVGALAAL